MPAGAASSKCRRAALRKSLTALHPASLLRRSVMLVGLGGNNGTTVLAGILANKKCVQSTQHRLRCIRPCAAAAVAAR